MNRKLLNDVPPSSTFSSFSLFLQSQLGQSLWQDCHSFNTNLPVFETHYGSVAFFKLYSNSIEKMAILWVNLWSSMFFIKKMAIWGINLRVRPKFQVQWQPCRGQIGNQHLCMFKCHFKNRKYIQTVKNTKLTLNLTSVTLQMRSKSNIAIHSCRAWVYQGVPHTVKIII